MCFEKADRDTEEKMKVLKSMFISLFVMCLFLAGCSGSSEPAGKTAEPAGEPDSFEISEQAMNNFIAKISEGNYTMRNPGYLETQVYSKDLVWFDYFDMLHDGFAVMSVNNETFQGFLEDTGLSYVTFLGEGQAIDTASPRLLNYWLDENVSGGNIYNLFYNQQDEPLTFVSYEDVVKESLVTFAGYSSNAVRLMQEVYLEMDDVNPSVVHVRAAVDDDLVARVSYDDIDITVTFGDAKSNAEAEAWMKNPVYPAARTDWDDMDEFILNSVFLPEYGREAVPFPKFASYAFMNDQENFVTNDEAYMRDSHASEEDMAAYIELLKSEGFTEAKDEGTGNVVYRKILREDYSCWSEIELEYNNGVDMYARKYYECASYDGLEEINPVITKYGFTALPESDNFTSVTAEDRADEQTESWLYFFDYDSVLYVNMDFKDREEAESYLETYVDGLAEAGFNPTGGDEEEPDRYTSDNEFASFKYQFADEDTVSLLYKVQRYISADEAEQMIAAAGFPEIDLREPNESRDLARFYKVQYGMDLKTFLTVSQSYDSAEEAEAFLNAYEEKLNAAGFERVNPDNVGTLKNIAIYNEEKGMLVALDFFETEGGASVNFDFKAE